LVPSTPQRAGVSSNNRSVIVPRTSSGGELATDSTSDAGDVALVLRKVILLAILEKKEMMWNLLFLEQGQDWK
jgi:hypothetical protein